MKAIIPVAGIGKRMRPHTYALPKVLLPVAGKPILGHILDELISIDVTEITLVIGYKGEEVKDYVESNYSIKANYIVQEKRKGLGHAIWTTREYHYDDSEVMIILGDTIFQADLRAMSALKGSSLAVKEVEDPRRFGIAVLDQKGEYIIDLEEKPEKPKSNLAIVGIYLIREPGLLFDSLTEVIEKDIKTKGEYQLTDGLKIMLDKGAAIKPFQIEGWLDCGKLDTTLATNRELLDLKISKQVALEYKEKYPDCLIRPPVFIAKGVELTNSIIGPHVSISEKAAIENAVISNAIIGEHTVIKNIILKDSIIGDNAVVSGHIAQLNICTTSEVHFR